MNALLVMWLALIPGFVLGYVGHELSHYAVLRATGRADGLSLWPPRAYFRTPTPVPVDVRLAAIAPVLAAVLLIAAVWVAPYRIGNVGWGIVIGACSRLCYLSPSDRAFAKGRAIVETDSTS